MCDFRLKHTMRETDCYVTHWSQSLDEVLLNCSDEFELAKACTWAEQFFAQVMTFSIQLKIDFNNDWILMVHITKSKKEI
jgi:hypothetical protein